MTLPLSTAVPSSAPSGYAELSGVIRRAGLLDRRPWFYVRDFAATFVLGAAVVTAMVVWRESWALLALAPVLSVVSTRFGFFGHDVGHRQVTHHRRLGRFLGLVSGNLLGGLSYSWWVAKHNAHHAHPNDLATDPDVAVGAIVWSAEQADERRGFGAWLTRHQAELFFPMLLGEAFNLHVSSVRTMFDPRVRGRVAESVLLAVHFAAYAALLVLTLTWTQALAFLLIHKGLQGIYLGLSFAPGHKGMPVLDAEQAADPLLRQVLTSRNVTGGYALYTALGGLNYQIEHHLFPSMPRPNLRLAQPLVREFCAGRGVSYTEASPWASYAAGLRHMRSVGAGLRARA